MSKSLRISMMVVGALGVLNVLVQVISPELIGQAGFFVFNQIIWSMMGALLINWFLVPDTYRNRDKERLDFLEQAMRERMVTLTGCMTVPMTIPIGTTDAENEHPFAYVHFNGIGQMGRGSTFRKAIDQAMP